MPSFADALRGVISEEIDRSSFGADAATYSSPTSVTPKWAEGASVLVREVTCPILNVTNKKGAPVALIYQDGVASFPMQIGTIRDETFDPTVSIRADLENDPNRLYLGTGTNETGIATKKTVSDALAAARTTADSAIALVAGADPALVSSTKVALEAVMAVFSALVSDAAYSSSLKGSP